MAADFDKPSGSSLRTAFMQEIRENIAAVAKMDPTGAANIPDGIIRHNPTAKVFEKYNAGTASWAALDISETVIALAALATAATNSDKVDNCHAGNADGNVPISNGTVNTNLNADMVDGKHAGNANGNVPVSNGTVNTNLNADMVDGYHANQVPTASAIPVRGSNKDFLYDRFICYALDAIYGAIGAFVEYIFQKVPVVVPAGKRLYLRRASFTFSGALIKLRVKGTTNTYTSSSNTSDETCTTLLRDNSGGGSPVTEIVQIGVYNSHNADQSTAQRDGYYVQLTIE